MVRLGKQEWGKLRGNSRVSIRRGRGKIKSVERGEVVQEDEESGTTHTRRHARRGDTRKPAVRRESTSVRVRQERGPTAGREVWRMGSSLGVQGFGGTYRRSVTVPS